MRASPSVQIEGAQVKKNKRKQPKPEAIDIFADVFHSFRDIRRVTPLAFVEKLKRRGVALIRRPTRADRGK
jgi:hypothetical protein